MASDSHPLTFQVGVNPCETVSVSLPNMQIKELAKGKGGPVPGCATADDGSIFDSLADVLLVGGKMGPDGAATGDAPEAKANANGTIYTVSLAIDQVNAARGAMGAIQNRVEHTIYNLQNIRKNMSESRSRIMDTDYAEEVAELTRRQVLKQASLATLVQANEQARDVLYLLRW